MNVPSIDGSRYIITFTDDYSRYLTVELMKNKSDALNCFIKFKATAENLHNKSIKQVHADRGSEFLANDWKFCEDNGIICTYAPRKTPQLNGIAE